ncbi:MAG: hypothetical protein H5T69_03310, partial [Chloroflexi bacterium]|nr:hypothetical protein [Chloroflexota bacterium]
MNKCTRFWIAALVVALLGACTSIESPFPPEPGTPGQETATAPFTPPPSPTPTPDGRMPKVVAELDLGLAEGDAYWPSAVAADGDRAYVLCQHIEDVADGPMGITVVDLLARRAIQTWPLEGQATGPLSVAGGRVYLYQEVGAGQRLVALDAYTGRILATAETEYLRSEDPLAVDVARQRLYVPLQRTLLVHHSETLREVARLAYPLETGERHIVLDPQGDRIYISLEAGLYAYRASDLTALWQAQTPAGRIVELVLDVGRGHILAQVALEREGQTASSLLIYSADGNLEGQLSPQGWPQGWKPVWADGEAGRIVLQAYDYSSVVAPVLTLWMADWQGQAVSTLSQAPLRWADAKVAAPLGREELFLLGWRTHRLSQLRAVDLEPIAQIALGVQLANVTVERGGRRLWVNSSAGDVYELNGTRAMQGELEVIRRLEGAGAGPLSLYRPGEWLLAAMADSDPWRVSAVDLERWQVSRVITGGTEIALDTRRARALVGSRSGTYPPQQGAVQVWDLARGERVGEVPLGGPPAYNPLRDEIVVGGYSAHVFDAESLAFKHSLTPDIDAQTCKGCTGQPAVTSVSVLPDLNLLALHMTITAAGKGPGVLPPPRFFALDTLEPVSNTVTYWQTCGGQTLFWPARDGRVFQNVLFSRYLYQANVAVRRAEDGALLAWRDGLSADLLSPDGRVLFDRRGAEWLAVDTLIWEPLGSVPWQCVHTYDAEANLFYALEGSTVRLLAPKWGEPLSAATPAPSQPRQAVRALCLSPAYAQDGMLFAVDDDGLYRSRDRGESWERLEDGLPAMDSRYGYHLTLAVSPAFAEDRTLFLGGWLGGYEGGSGGSQGLGVWRSIDGGDSWEPSWAGLVHLNVEKLVISPRFADDGGLLAYCRYVNLIEGDAGKSLFRSSDRGESWEMVAQLSQRDPITKELPAPEEVLTPARGDLEGMGSRIR